MSNDLKSSVRGRFVVVAVLSALLGMVAGGSAASPAARMTIVEKGEARASIVVSPDAAEDVRKAAVTLQEYIQKATGGVLEIKDRGHGRHIQVGMPPAVNDNGGLPKDLGRQEFAITFVKPDQVVILGGSDLGTQYGVLEFIERYIGVRWLMPGEMGEYVPKSADLKIPCVEVREKPAYDQRLLSHEAWWNFDVPPKSPWWVDMRVWARRLRMVGTIKFSHNLYNLFAPAKYRESHPEFYPVYSGKRVSPADNERHSWEPCFSAEGIIDEAVKTICEYFAANPEATSYSLGINDTSRFCECDTCQAAYTEHDGLKNFYYHWVNTIAERVAAVHPGKKLGLLAYFQFENAPDMTLHPSVVPVRTYGFMQWSDPACKASGHVWIDDWLSKTTEFGVYDYVYGGRWYKIPRVWNHTMAEYIRYLAEKDTRYYYAEAYPSDDFQEGPKLYLLLKLLWHPNLDIDIALDEWCNAAVGAKAGPPLRDYYTWWEDYWATRIPTLEDYWCIRMILPTVPYRSLAYMSLLEESDMDYLESLMDQVVAAAGTGKQTQRAEHFQKTFVRMRSDVQEYLDNNRDDMLAAMPRVRFNGTERASIADADQTGLDFGNDDFIIETWFKPDMVQVNLLEKGRPGGGGHGISFSTSGVIMKIKMTGDSGTANNRSENYLIDLRDEWYHMFFVFDRDEKMRLFRNTAIHGMGDISGVGEIRTDAPFTLGYCDNRFYKGVFGPVRVYRFADGLPVKEELTAALQYNYDNPSKVDERLLGHCVARWDMNGTSANTLTDTSGNGNDLSVEGKIVRLQKK